MESLKALVRRPSPQMENGLITHLDREPVDAGLALRQWQDYVSTLQEAGWDTIEVEPAPDLPDSAFIEDTVVTYGDLAVITRPGAPERRPETAATETAARAAGYRIARITRPGMLDGGDVLKFDGTVWVGRGDRTNQEGIDQLAAHLAGFGARVVPVDLTRVLHLKSAVTALPDGTVIGYPPLVDNPGVYERFLAVPEAHGGHVVLLGGDRLLMSTSAPETTALLRERGYETVTVDISEFEKLEGCVTCLSVRMRGI